MFCYPEQIAAQMDGLFGGLAQAGFLRGLDREAFAGAAANFLSELNVIHPFREGNGRAQKAFLVLLAEQAGHPIDVRKIQREAYIAAMITAFHGDEGPLAGLIRTLLAKARG